jgi:hypothetical protein
MTPEHREVLAEMYQRRQDVFLDDCYAMREEGPFYWWRVETLFPAAVTRWLDSISRDPRWTK